jgi:sulfur carrier protein
VTVTVNGAVTDVGPGTTVDAVVALLGARPVGTAVAVNGEVVPRSAWTTRTIRDGDAVEVLAAVSGG